jgi:hypothetical protein
LWLELELRLELELWVDCCIAAAEGPEDTFTVNLRVGPWHRIGRLARSVVAPQMSWHFRSGQWMEAEGCG